MQRAAKILGIVFLGLACVWFYACGSGSDLLDENEQRYRAMISIQDLDQETLSIDVVQSMCDSDAEDYGPASAAVDIEVDADAPGITLQRYVLEYIPLTSEDGVSGFVMPPALDDPLPGGNLGIDIPSGGSASFEITCMSVDTKEEYRRAIGWLYNYETAAGQAELALIQTDIDNLNADIDVTQAALLAAIAAGDDALIESLTAQLDQQLELLESLQLQYWQVYYSFDYDLTNPLVNLDEGRYRIRITFEFRDEYGEDRTIVREATVWLGNFDNC